MKASSLILLSSTRKAWAEPYAKRHTRKFLYHSRVFVCALVSLFIILSGVAFAEFDDSHIIYPLAELGNCKDKAVCFAYCDNPDHIVECVAFAEREGLMSKKEANLARAMGTGSGPLGCRGKECEIVCSDPKNMVACMNFALENPEILSAIAAEEGVAPEQMRQEMTMVQQALAKGAKLPGGCEGRECKDLCMAPPSEAVARDCFAFAKAAGFMEDVPEGMSEDVMVKIMMGGMKDEDGNIICRGEDCEEVCSEDPEVCMEAMGRLGIDMTQMIPAGDREQITQGMKMMEQALAQAPPPVLECIDKELSSQGTSLAALRGGDIKVMMKIGPEMQDIMEGCFSEGMGEMMGGGFGPPGGMMDGGFGPPDGFGPPGAGDDFDEMGLPPGMSQEEMMEKMKQAGQLPEGQEYQRQTGDIIARCQEEITSIMMAGSDPSQASPECLEGMKMMMGGPVSYQPYGNNLTAKILDTIADLLGF